MKRFIKNQKNITYGFTHAQKNFVDGFTRPPNQTSDLGRDIKSCCGFMFKPKIKTSLVDGFTLIELLVSLTLFTVVFTISAGSVVSILDANRSSRSMESVMNNLNLALEGMTIDLRFGNEYHCSNNGSGVSGESRTPEDCVVNPGDAISFLDRDGLYRAYYLSNNQLYRYLDGQGQSVPVTAKEVKINQLSFYVTGTISATNNDFSQPKIMVVVRGEAGGERSPSKFDLQTTISQRVLDL
ncbi:MAG: prepilin-type N-terminal cleavage/methylation domain-containing protein [Parcubacteria group bacterium]|nr:prepilin-type N-terminal cleavage/methylation domain-containing protein [Parcubacteria group bacterium]